MGLLSVQDLVVGYGPAEEILKGIDFAVETGEIVLSEGPSLWRPGQPAKNVQEIHKAAGLEVQG